MSKAQVVITAVVLEGRSKVQVARDYDLSRQWVHQLVTRYQVELDHNTLSHKGFAGHDATRLRRLKLLWALTTGARQSAGFGNSLICHVVECYRSVRTACGSRRRAINGVDAGNRCERHRR
jgi:hypothetical protein